MINELDAGSAIAVSSANDKSPRAPEFANDAFISYSRADSAFASTLETALERFRPHAGLGSRSRLEIFRDVNDFTAGDYDRILLANLKSSAALVVVCTPNARDSKYVNEEVRSFARLHGSSANIIPILLSGIPNNEASPEQHAEKAFPEALCEVMQMPLAVDYRGFASGVNKVDKGKFESAWFTLLANLFGVSRNQIEERERRRQIQLRNRWVAGLFVTAVVFAGLAIWALLSQRKAQAQQVIAEARERAAQSARLVAESRNTNALRSLMFAIEADGILPSDGTISNLVQRIQYYRNIERSWWQAPGTWHPLAVAPDGKSAVTADGNGVIHAWSLPLGADLGHLPTNGERVTSLSFSGDGSALIGGSNSGSVIVWNVSDRKILDEKKTGVDESITTVGVNKDASLIVAGVGANVVLWTGNSRDAASLTPGSEDVTRVAVSQNGRYVAAGSDDRTVTVWDARTKVRLKRLRGHSSEISALAFAPNSAKIASAGENGEIRLWDLKHGTFASLQGTHDIVRSVSFSRSGRWLASGGREGAIRIWDLQRNTEIPFEFRGQNVDELSILPDDVRIIAAGVQGEIVVWNTQIVHPLASVLYEHESDTQILALAVSADGRLVASGDSKGTVLVVPIGAPSALVRPWPALGTSIRSIAISSDGHFLVAGTEGGVVRAWDIQRQQDVELAPVGVTGAVLVVGFQPGSHAFAAAGDDGTIRLLNLDEPLAPPRVLPPAGTRIWSLAFDKAGDQLVAGRDDGRLSFWERDAGATTDSWTLTKTSENNHRDSVGSVGYLRDFKTVVSAGHTFDSTIRFWDATTATPVGEPMPIELGGIERIALSRDGTRIGVVGGKNVVVLNAYTHATVAVLDAPGAGYTSELQFIDNNDHLAVASGNRILVYNLSRANLISVACAKAGRSFTAEEWRTLVGSDVPRNSASCAAR